MHHVGEFLCLHRENAKHRGTLFETTDTWFYVGVSCAIDQESIAYKNKICLERQPTQDKLTAVSYKPPAAADIKKKIDHA